MPKIKKTKKKISEHTVPYSPGENVDWDNVFNEIDEVVSYDDTRTDRQKARAAQGHDELARREKVLPPGHLSNRVMGSEYKHKDDPRYQGMYKIKGPKGVLPEAEMDPELANLMKKYGVSEVDEADTKTKDTTGMDWDTMFDEPTSKGDLAPASSSSSNVPGPQSTADLKRGSRADTARATGNITPTDDMRDMMSRINVPMDDAGVDEPTQDVVPYENITPDHVPATISRAIAMSDPHAINPTWHAVANLPGNMSRAILTLGKALFRAFTKTPTEEIVMIGNVGGQGPNSTREVNGVADWVRRNGQEVDDANIDFGQTIPGYSAQVKHYVANGIRFKIVKDQFGDYIYAWPEHDSLNRVEQIGNDEPAQRPSRALPRR